MIKKLIAVPAVALCLSASAAMADDAEIGLLTCKLTGVDNLIVYTDQKFDCNFKPNKGDEEKYTGQIKSIGIDLSVKKDMVIIWSVLAPSSGAYSQGNLRGTYVGGSADVALGAGFGAKVLVGGGENSFTLQPVSVTGVEGVGASLGVDSFELK
jgi:hypothetical protein